MKLTKLEGNENYCATVVKLPPKQKIDGLDRLVRVTVFGNDVLTQKSTDETLDYLFFPAECAISEKYLSLNNEYRHTEKNKDRAVTGYFEDTGRVKAIKFKGVISTGYIAPVNSLEGVVDGWNDLKEGDEFNTINGLVLARKYKIVHTQGSGNTESKYNKKLKRFDKLVPNQFRFHESTSPLAKNLHQFNPEDVIVITDKWHGTSAVFANVLVKQKLTLLQKIVYKLVEWVEGKKTNYTEYDILYASRTVVKNQYINKDATAGYYNEDIWGIVKKEIEDKIEKGITIYGEIVGFLQSGKAIQKGYDYGCQVGLQGGSDGTIATATDSGTHKLVVYRITYTKPDGSTIEFSWQQIKNYCKKYSLETVKELYYGPNSTLINLDRESWANALAIQYLEKDCPHCVNKVPAEGIVVRIDGREHYMSYKLKSKRFLKKETDDLDAAEKSGEINIEETN